MRVLSMALLIFAAWLGGCATEPSEQESPSADATPLSYRFEKLVTDKAIEGAVETYAQQIEAELKGEYSWRKDHNVFRAANKSGRFAVYEQVFGENWYKLVYHANAMTFHPDDWWRRDRDSGEKYTTEPWNIRQHLMGTLREELSSPNKLERRWLKVQRKLIGALKARGVSGQAKADLQSVLPYFDGSLDRDAREDLAVYAKLNEDETVARAALELFSERYCQRRQKLGVDRPGSCYNYGDFDQIPEWTKWSEIYGQRQQWEQRFHQDGVDFFTYQWVERRRAEGGDDLVAAWARVIAEAIEAL